MSPEERIKLIREYERLRKLAHGLPVYVAMQRVGERYLDLAWECRHAVDNAFTRYLRGLDAKPQCRVILGNPETMRKHYLNLDEVAIADQVFTQMGAYQAPCVGNVLGLPPKKRRNLLTAKEVMKLPDKDSNLGLSG